MATEAEGWKFGIPKSAAATVSAISGSPGPFAPPSLTFMTSLRWAPAFAQKQMLWKGSYASMLAFAVCSLNASDSWQ